MSKSILEIIPESLREQLVKEVRDIIDKEKVPANPPEDGEAKSKEQRIKAIEDWAKRSLNPYNQ